MPIPSLTPLNYQIVLASSSPRRKQLLEQLGLSFEVRKINVDESYPKDIPIKDIAEYLSRKKAIVSLEQVRENEVIICADTTVLMQGIVLGKPKHETEARKMLKNLSGKRHEVISGVCLAKAGKLHSFSVSTQVFMKRLLEEEIDYYISEFSPFDKAGAYGIQEWIGMIAVERIEGSYYNVMGLPVKELYEELKHF